MFIKICGLTTPAAVSAAIEAGADAVGFVFSRSPRQVTPRAAAELASALPAGIKRVAVFRHPEAELVAAACAALSPDWVQTDADDFGAIELPGDCEPLPVYRNGGTPLPAGTPARLLFEGPTSGSGKVADWHEARTLAERTALILAGGLHPGNVAEAIRAVRPWGVDVSSGVEDAPGVKSTAKIHEFIARAREVANAR